MNILHPDIVEFIEQVTTLNIVGGLLAPRSSVERLVDLLNRADVIVGPDVRPGRATYYRVEKDSRLEGFAVPAILVIAEEDFDTDPAYAEQVRNKVPYLMRVR